MKQFYRITVTIIVFIISIYIFSGHISEKDNGIETVKETQAATFPVLYVQVGDELINPMHGYTANIEARYIRDGIVSIDEEQKCSFKIKANETEVKKVIYEVSACGNEEEIIDTGIIRTFKKDKTYQEFDVKISKELNENEEYALKIALITDKGDKIYYFARVKKNEDTVDDKIIKFAKDFHSKTIDKSKAEELRTYLETDASKMDNKDLSYVNIKSNLDTISFCKLAPKVISDLFVTIREVADNTAVLEIKYYATAKTPSGDETYEIKEGYRIRWTADRTYLLYYERCMESVFDIGLVSLAENEFKLGITQDAGTDITTSEDNSKIYFVRNGELWYYNAPLNDCAKVFSFKQDKGTDYFRDVYDAHNIKVLNVEDNGDAYFMVYGYMNRGDYEGRMTIVLYKHHVEQNRIEEQVNIPVDIPYAVLNEKINDFAYVSDKDVFYFSLAESIYAYDIKQGKVETIAKGINEENMILSKKGDFLAWQESDGKYTHINVMKLRSKKVTRLEAPGDKCIKLLGEMQGNMIYGYAAKSNVAGMMDGTKIVPLSEVIIATIDGKVAKTYKPKDSYVVSMTIEDNKMILKRVKKGDSGKFIATSDESIFNNQIEKNSNFSFNHRETDATLTEWYMTIPEGYQMNEVPQVRQVENTIIKGDTTVRVYEDLMKDKYYFVYSYYGLEVGYDNAADAIVKADERMGNVFDNQGNIIWERGIAPLTTSVSDIDKIGASGGSINACIRILLKHSGKDINVDEISKVDGSIEEKIDKFIDGTAINYTGTPLEKLDYSISKDKPIIAMKSGNSAVVITAYTQTSITYYDPNTGGKTKVGRSNAKDTFGKVGNVFISYVK
ncbi:MAG: hypothetical protein E7262_08525 [Lachnospiraceae bacterium]|nr:hypothetical protein [Lachnospiraceae bacterium]